MKYALHLLAAVGLLSLALVFSGFTAPFPAVVHNIIDNANDFDGRPGPKTSVVIRGATGYTVPAGKCLVITAIGLSDPPTSFEIVSLLIDSVIEVEVKTISGEPPSVREISYPGYVALAGEVVSLTTTDTAALARAWGYLITP